MRGNLQKIMIGLVVVIVLAFIFFSGDSLVKLVDTIKQGTPFFIIAAVVAQLCKYLAQGRGFQACFNTVNGHISYRTGLSLVFGTFFMNTVAPSMNLAGTSLVMATATRNGMQAGKGTTAALLMQLSIDSGFVIIMLTTFGVLTFTVGLQPGWLALGLVAVALVGGLVFVIAVGGLKPQLVLKVLRPFVKLADKILAKFKKPKSPASVSPFGITWQEAQSTQVLSGAVGSRVDNSITYASPRMAGFQVHLQASNGIDLDDSVRSSYKDRYAAAGVTYRAGGLRFVAAVDRMFTKNAQAPGTAGYRGDDWMTYNIGGSYDFGMVRIHAGYQYGDGVTRVGKISSSVKGAWSATNEKNTTGFDTHGFVLGANIDVAGGELKVATGYVKGERDWKRFRDDGSLSYTYDQEVEGYQFALGYLYPFSKRTDFYVAGAYVHGKDVTDSIKYLSTGNVAAKDATKSHLKSFIAGIRHSF